ncbi:RNA polymerase sigma-54 factor [Ereboglobus sp. PH5-10]|uniref:RNA polymerase sigma-54 factor n=1 Tax=Ereboglobus luteus TaxID=1796921 RepID=A0A2U8E5H6_9BACT|nr:MULTISPECIES: RNA polymerase factor sigma-54 [Ereboglobus]AWI10070.1 RNA polymerase sigma-54 factor [Ereboglobus luteus]MDF9826517.1 RNA polymerase sigma-54 factor [Ereboglobus sp. PH5-10]
MSGNLNQGLQQRQTQNLVLAPQLRQSLKILQVAALDLRSVIQEELQSNPTLEELANDTGSISLERAAEDAANRDDPAGDNTIDRPNSDDPGSDDATTHILPADDTPDDNSRPEALDFSNGKEYEILQKLDQDWHDHMANAGGAQPYTSDDAEKRQHFLESITAETSLQEHLREQADLADRSPQTTEALNYLIGSLDDRGYLTQSPNDIALQTGLPLDAVQKAHRLLQTFDPTGIGGENIQECLLIQLAAKNRADSLAASIIRDHFDLLTRRRIPELARKLAVPADDVQAAIAEIGALDPAPGRRFAHDSNRVVIPDVTVTKDGDEWKIELNNDYIPRLRISNTYRELIAKGGLTKQERDYIQERIRSGKFLINSIEQRQQTIERITREILKIQREFFEEGVSKLKPLTMIQIADIVGVHETTVSRAIANKYIKTPHGTFEFKYFFTSGYQAGDGAAVSNTSVKEMIADLIAVEDRAHPLSDQDLVEKLAEKSITIARRTVAKYREELNILPSNLRRDYTG